MSSTFLFSLVLLLNFIVYISIPAFYRISDPDWQNSFIKFLILSLSVLLCLFYLLSPFIIFFYPFYFNELSFLFIIFDLNFLIYFKILGLVLLSFATLIIFIARKELNRFSPNIFISSGIFKLIRHPVYLSYCLYFLSFFLIFPSFFTLILLLGIIGYYETASFEEKIMINKFGENYENYKKSTGKFIPKFTTLK